jgi:hypothetical protein
MPDAPILEYSSRSQRSSHPAGAHICGALEIPIGSLALAGTTDVHNPVMLVIVIAPATLIAIYGVVLLLHRKWTRSAMRVLTMLTIVAGTAIALAGGLLIYDAQQSSDALGRGLQSLQGTFVIVVAALAIVLCAVGYICTLPARDAAE